MTEPTPQETQTTPPMSLLDGIRSGIVGATLLARGHPEGIQQIAGDPDAARTSFWAAALCLPTMLVLRLWDAGGTTAGPAADTAQADPSLHGTLSVTLLYVVGWAGYALLSRQVATVMGRQPRWPLFIAAWNWCNLIQYALFTAAALPGWIGAPAWIGQTLGIVALFWAMWLQWFATRIALGIGRWTAIALVALDILMGIVLTG